MKNGWINIIKFKTAPVVTVDVELEVIYKNGNGEWYKGITRTGEQWHDAWLSPNKRIFGVKVDFPDISLILKKTELFTITDWA